jgi:hypothetical protein
VRVAVVRHDLEDAVVDGPPRHTEGATAKIVTKMSRSVFLSKSYMMAAAVSSWMPSSGCPHAKAETSSTMDSKPLIDCPRA